MFDFSVPNHGRSFQLTGYAGCKWLYRDRCAPLHTCQYTIRSAMHLFADSSFPQKMIDDLQILSEEWVSENRDLSRRGYEGSPMRSSPVAGLPNEVPGVPYQQSQASRRSDRSDPTLPGSQESPYMDNRYIPQPAYSSATGQAGYTSTSGYPPGSNYPPPQAPGYSSTPGYAQVAGYQPSPAYPQGTAYPSGHVYPTASGYATPGYPAPVGRTGNPNDQNYTYDTDYSSQGYQYRQPGAYPSGAQPRDPRADPRTDPRLAAGYPYVSSPQEPSMRGAAIDDRYGAYGQSMPTAQAGRGGFPTPARGAPTGGYDPPQPRDGFDREPVREERRRR